MTTNSDRCKIVCADLGIGAQLMDTAEGPVAICRTLGLKPDFELKNPGAQQSVPIQDKARLPIVSGFCAELAKITRDVVLNNGFPLVLGGDHSIAVGTWSGVTAALNAQQKFGLIWIDAHLDSHTYETSPSKAYHGMPVAALLGEAEAERAHILSPLPKISPENLVFIGSRSYESEELELLTRNNVKIFYAKDVKEKGLQHVLSEAKKIATNGTVGFGVSLDLDFFDPEFAPGVGSPEPQGESPTEFMRYIDILLCDELKGFEITELNPKLDIDNKTARVAAFIVEKVMAWSKSYG